jgi:hypothetical protein
LSNKNQRESQVNSMNGQETRSYTRRGVCVLLFLLFIARAFTAITEERRRRERERIGARGISFLFWIMFRVERAKI